MSRLKEEAGARITEEISSAYVPKSPSISADTSDNKAEEKQKLKNSWFLITQLEKHEKTFIQVNY